MDDLISRQLVLELLEKNHKVLFYTDDGYGSIVRSIKQLPSVSVSEKLSNWEWKQSKINPQLGDFCCSECGDIIICFTRKDDTEMLMKYYKYCPNCGAKMGEIEQ